jgi:murein DD-endopeptidase MepM/ murein hydrolase activator NlpD
MKQVAIVFILMVQLFAFKGLEFSSLEVKNGETVLAKFHAYDELMPTAIHIEKKVYPFYRINFSEGEYYALLPIDYNEKLGFKTLLFEYTNKNVKKIVTLPKLNVVWGKYKKETLNVNKSKIELSKKDQRRTEKEYHQAMKLYAKKSKRFLPMNKLQEPLQTFITSKFGNERLFNGKRKSFHSGVDYRAKTGTAIHPMGFGKVVMVADRFYAGLSIVVDHGQGIYSGYYHMSKSNVQVGDIVNEDDLIGLSGASGRITGPHLHFSLKIHSVTVNPLQFMEIAKELL